MKITALDILSKHGEMNLDLLEQEDFDEFDLSDEELDDLGYEKQDERVVKKVVRKGVIKKKVFCRPGFKAKDGKCVPMSAREKNIRKRASVKAVRKKKTKSKAAANRSRKRSLRRRTF